MIKRYERVICKICIIVTLVLINSLVINNKPVNAATVGKPKSVKIKTAYKTYKGYKSSDDLRLKNIKYMYGKKISWKKVSKAVGYEIYAYGVASEKWRLVKRTKKTSYIITNLFSKDKFNIKVRAYKIVNKEKVYSKWSKTKTIKTKYNMRKINKGGIITKTFHERYASEQAFILQNSMRKKVGSNNLKWSESIYKICCSRAKDLSIEYSHDLFKKTSLEVLKKYYGITTLAIPVKEGSFTTYHDLVSSENIAEGQDSYVNVMNSWKRSKGHYNNLKSSEHIYGAIACYSTGNSTYWAAIFSNSDIEKELGQ